MHIPFHKRFEFFKVSVRKNAGPLAIGAVFVCCGFLLMYLGFFVTENSILGGFGLTFISFSGMFLLYTIPSSYRHYYEQEVTKAYGSYTTAKVIHKRVDDYSYTSSTIEDGTVKTHEDYVYAIVFEFHYNHKRYTGEFYFEHKSTFQAIARDSELPIQFLRHNPNQTKLRRRKLSNALGISEDMCQ